MKKYVVLDVDERNASGQRLRESAALHGKVLPPTAEVSLSDDGLHYRLYYAVPENVMIVEKWFWEKRVCLCEVLEADIVFGLGLGAGVDFEDIQPAPEWLVDLLKSATPEAAAPQEIGAPALPASPPEPEAALANADGERTVQTPKNIQVSLLDDLEDEEQSQAQLECTLKDIEGARQTTAGQSPPVDGVLKSGKEAGGESAVEAVDVVSVTPSPSVDGVDRREPSVRPVQASAVDGVDEIIVDSVDGVTLRQSRIVDGVEKTARLIDSYYSVDSIKAALREFILAGDVYPVYEEARVTARPCRMGDYVWFYAQDFAKYYGCSAQEEYQRVYKALASVDHIECRRSLRVGDSTAKMHRIRSAVVDEWRANQLIRGVM